MENDSQQNTPAQPGEQEISEEVIEDLEAPVEAQRDVIGGIIPFPRCKQLQSDQPY